MGAPTFRAVVVVAVAQEMNSADAAFLWLLVGETLRTWDPVVVRAFGSLLSLLRVAVELDAETSYL